MNSAHYIFLTLSVNLFIYAGCANFIWLTLFIYLGAAKEKQPTEDRKPDNVNKEGAEPEAGSQQLSKAELKRLRREKQVNY